MSTRPDPGEPTRAALIATARALFAERGYADVGTEEVVQRSGVTRGALYHHFADKRDLFRAVYEETEHEVVASIAARMDAGADPFDQLTAGLSAFLEACTDPELARIGVRDAPAVLGWEEWREIGARYGLGLLTGALRAGMEAGTIRRADVTTLAHLLLSALGEAALLVGSAADPEKARAEVDATLRVLLDGLRA